MASNDMDKRKQPNNDNKRSTEIEEEMGIEVNQKNRTPATERS